MVGGVNVILGGIVCARFSYISAPASMSMLSHMFLISQGRGVAAEGTAVFDGTTVGGKLYNRVSPTGPPVVNPTVGPDPGLTPGRPGRFAH